MMCKMDDTGIFLVLLTTDALGTALGLVSCLITLSQEMDCNPSKLLTSPCLIPIGSLLCFDWYDNETEKWILSGI